MRALVLAVLLLIIGVQAQAQEPDLVLTGEIDETAHQTYLELPFVVPTDVAALTVEF